MFHFSLSIKYSANGVSSKSCVLCYSLLIALFVMLIRIVKLFDVPLIYGRLLWSIIGWISSFLCVFCLINKEPFDAIFTKVFFVELSRMVVGYRNHSVGALFYWSGFTLIKVKKMYMGRRNYTCYFFAVEFPEKFS